ncbi:acyltransferase family protein [Maribacter sp. 2307ULW6-5]|uniref:acyltransferase family protein n=1 Tax=Maribacter sp. 2307ULW6-5 TaxID=3386275 RepID=UPI0039BCD3A1
MKKERIAYIDRLRGVNIFLVVMGHVITANVINGETSKILVYGSTFRMPLFMFLCGYIASKVIKPQIFERYGLFVLKKCRTLLVPFFAWPLLVEPFFFSDAIHFNYWGKIKELLNGGGLWFLYYLFFITQLYSLWLFFSHRFNKQRRFFLDLLFLAGIGLALSAIWKMDIIGFMTNFMLFFVFYFTGVLMAKYEFLSKILVNSKVFSAALLAFVLLVGHYEYGFSSLTNTLVKVSSAFAAIVVFYYLVKHLTWPPALDKHIRHWGVHSLVIYVTHGAVSAVFSHAFIPASFQQVPLFLITGSLTLVVVMICMFVYGIVKRSGAMNFLLYGNRPNYY